MLDFLPFISWRPVIGDPSVMGWITVGAYGVTAAVAALTVLSAPRKDISRRVWAIVSIGMFLLAMNKQLDIQSLFTDIGRVLFKSQGWYEQRRKFQSLFVVLLVSISLLFFGASCFLLRPHVNRYGLLLSGVFFLLTFIAVRAASFHHIDRVLNFRIYRAKMNWILELSGTGMILLSALRDLARNCRNRPIFTLKIRDASHD